MPSALEGEECEKPTNHVPNAWNDHCLAGNLPIDNWMVNFPLHNRYQVPPCNLCIHHLRLSNEGNLRVQQVPTWLELEKQPS